MATAPDTASGAPPAEGPPILLDVSRLLSRVGLGPATGIDRVEAAWLAHLQSDPRHLLLARLPGRQVLLPRAAGAALLGWLQDPQRIPPRGRGLIARLRRGDTPRIRAEEALARMAVATGSARGRFLARHIRAAFPGGGCWLALGHANLAPGPWRGLGRLGRAVLIHDTIPLDHPAYTRPDQVGSFRRRLVAALGGADVILTVSEATRADVLRWRGRLQHAPRPGQRIVAAPIGTVLGAPGVIPADIPLDRPYFVAVGTIEPRKNHAVLLDAWEALARRLPSNAVPRLVIIGRRGWMNEAVFARLDALPPGSPVIECAGLDDGAVSALIEGAHGALMPSRAEGFGLPLTEAAGRGVPVLAAPTPAGREVLGDDGAVWLDPDDARAWADAIARLAAGPAQRRSKLAIRGWNDHFSRVAAILPWRTQ